MCILLQVCLCITYVSDTLRGQKALGPLELELIDKCGPPCRCGESNLCPLEEQPGLVCTKPSLQAHVTLFFCLVFFFF